MDSVLRMDQAGRWAAEAEIADFYANGPYEYRGIAIVGGEARSMRPTREDDAFEEAPWDKIRT